jgi:hypothetical protein
MHLNAGKICSSGNGDRGTMTMTASCDRGSGLEGIAPATLDVGLFRALHKIGASKQRICSALWLSYEEYDLLSKQL